jgi:hypothetical protein
MPQLGSFGSSCPSPGASELLRVNIHPKVVSEGLGHASTAFTMDVCSHLLPSIQESASAAIEASLYRQGG